MNDNKNKRVTEIDSKGRERARRRACSQASRIASASNLLCAVERVLFDLFYTNAHIHSHSFSFEKYTGTSTLMFLYSLKEHVRACVRANRK